MRLLATLLAALVCVTVAYDPTQPFEVPKVYEATAIFHMPYIDFTEPVHTYLDANKGAQRFEYYSGTDVYIFNTVAGKKDYSVVPVNSVATCFQSNASGTTLQHVFPNMSKFTYQPSAQQMVVTEEYPNGILCDTWKYVYGTITADPENNGSAYAKLPDDEGYSGNYTFYVSSQDGTPVQFHMIGHNVVLGGSHYDEYVLNYLSVNVLDEVDDQLLLPPSGLPCHDNDNPYGPTYRHRDGGSTLPDGVIRSNPKNDIHMLFPEGMTAKQRAFEAYEKAHGKVYHKKERSARKFLFHRNLRYISAANRQGRSFSVAPNHLADRTEQEIMQLMGYRRPSNKPLHKSPGYGSLDGTSTACGLYTNSGATQPKEVDWRVTCPKGSHPGCMSLTLPPKDQGTCGSCWTYGTTGAIEAAWAKKMGTITPLSQQSIVDCTWKYGVQGCNGGTDYLAYAYILEQNNGSVASADSYGPYMSQDGYCHYDLSTSPPNIVNPWNHNNVTAGAVMQQCFHVGPQWNCTTPCVTWQEAVDTMSDAIAAGNVLSVAIDATNPDFYFYTSGFYYSPKCLAGIDDLDHQVLAVGYTMDSEGQRYTIIKNSWSTHWGEEGFVKISQKDNCCGVATQPTFVVA